MAEALSLPFSGSVPISRHRSAQAAQAASITRVTKTLRYLDLLAHAGEDGFSDHETVRMTGWPLSSVCSIRNGAARAGLVVPGARVGVSPYGVKVTCWRRRSTPQVAS